MTDAPLLIAPPTTSAEQDRHTKGQRRINLIWEMTQALLAVVVSGTTLFVGAKLALGAGDRASDVLGLMSNAFFLIIGFYFGRTNHSRLGDGRRP